MRRGDPLEICCPSCKDGDFQKAKSITLEGGREVDWAKRKEHNWAQARILFECLICGNKYYIHRKQKS